VSTKAALHCTTKRLARPLDSSTIEQQHAGWKTDNTALLTCIL